MIVLSRGLLLEPSTSVSLEAPVILWESVVTRDTITASSEHEDYPATNLATDSTIERWRAAAAGLVTIEVDSAGEEVDAIGIARHNFGSNHTISIEAEIAQNSGAQWVEVIAPNMLPDNSPVLFRFAPIVANRFRIHINGGNTPPSAAVIYAGKLLVLPHGISAGHVPLDQAHETQLANGRSEAGNFLGRIITGQSAQTTASFDMLPIGWYYEAMEPFIARGTTGPFFFAWLPQDRPQDVGFAWLNADPRPSMGSLFFDVSLDIGGITW
ncbi:discoidin domain-containing protein [Devosia aurantiaca]|uniref:Discoidin domain-containing protein n=1 Tax=Devosia aurantiaca TaxID=2714858 RepID=A0A6M1SQU5_9HYPH|nr:discoidin domain-containing protein [Devosia aurantiaca]NGP18926.1 discoidin domain-containing protein [Devosia aurantiaca]